MFLPLSSASLGAKWQLHGQSLRMQTSSSILESRGLGLGTTSIDLPYGQREIGRASSAVRKSCIASRADVIHIRSLSSHLGAPATDLQT